MNSPESPNPYHGRYPRQGKIAVLCEGDIAGFEVDLLEKWTALGEPSVFVDVWACGTKTAIFGLSDAIGRAVPVVVIEDRDFRQPEDAVAQCRGYLEDRLRRAVAILGWKAWVRNEIENYLIEPVVLSPVLAQFFLASEQQVHEALESTISALRTDQAAQAFLGWFQNQLPDRFRIVQGLPRATHRVSWIDAEHQFRVPEVSIVAAKLRGIVESAATKQRAGVETASWDKCAEKFESLAAGWNNVVLGSPEWRIDWAGKEVLTQTCRALYATYGLRHDVPGLPLHVDWGELTQARRDAALERETIRFLQPHLVESLLALMNDHPEDPTSVEWIEIRRMLSDAVKQPNGG